ncbi:AGAP000321-PA-like protein [Anopheles sinensis]|uniref:AGAP000321-PA-like protein n=1 Tax=Anopheles sinensis TaxID=74873 RepID=A0A084VJF6_ANOSI|nr:AGAP000321-PA-like protein [Anopheles sinensis]
MLSPKAKRAPGAPPPPPPPKPEKPSGRIAQDDDGGGGGVTNNNSVAPNGHGATVPSRIPDEEQVVMTPLGKTNTSTVLLVERKLIEAVGERTHVAGGDHRGIIINKTTEEPSSRQRDPAQLSLEFRVFLVSANTGQHSQESRRIKFWFRPWLTSDDVQAQVAQDFFRELVSPKEFPRDYVGFIKKIMKLLQKGYNEIQAIEIELRILEQTSAPPSRPSRPGHVIICYGNCHKRAPNSNDSGEHKTYPGGGGGGGDVSFEDEQFEVVPLTPEKILELIEQAYPNPITPDDLAKDHGWEEEEVMAIMLVLKERGLIKSMEYNSYTRIHHDDQAIKIVKQMPTIASNKQPTIAIITAQYCEKLAVDAMLENKETFVRYTTVGESNVYTLGNIGAHRIVSTKLPSVGSTREAMTAAGNTTTRLLGTFQKVDHVFIVGVAGGIPHYTDYRRHVRLGDVVIAAAVPDAAIQKPYCYVYSGPGEVKRYYPIDDGLQAIARTLAHNEDGKRPWVRYVQEGLQQLGGGGANGESHHQHDFARPAPNTDKLYMNIGNRNVIEVAHPVATPSQDDPDGNDGTDGAPTTRLHAGPIGSGHELVRSDSARTEYAQAYNLLATDVEMNSVLDSIVGNCRESFILVKGIADYKDGTTSRKWQNYASLAAAAVMKTIVCAMDAPTNV